MGTARWAGSWPVRRPRTSPTRTPTAKPSTSRGHVERQSGPDQYPASPLRCRVAGETVLGVGGNPGDRHRHPGRRRRLGCRRRPERDDNLHRRNPRRRHHHHHRRSRPAASYRSTSPNRPLPTAAAWYFPHSRGKPCRKLVSGAAAPNIDVMGRGGHFRQDLCRLKRPYQHRLQAGLPIGWAEGLHPRFRGRRRHRQLCQQQHQFRDRHQLRRCRQLRRLRRTDHGGLGGAGACDDNRRNRRRNRLPALGDKAIAATSTAASSPITASRSAWSAPRRPP